MRILIELDLVDDNSYDLSPDQLLLVEGFDELKNENFPDAGAFVSIVTGPQQGHLLTKTDFDTIAKTAKQLDPMAWVELVNQSGNRTLVRRDFIKSRRSLEEGSLIELEMLGQQSLLQVRETVAELREKMNSATPTLKLVENA